MLKRLCTGACLLMALLWVVSACASGDSNGGSNEVQAGSGTQQFNKADVDFAQKMIPHHEQALRMARMAQDRANSQQVRSLAENIQAAQAPEIRLMTGWLKSWGKNVPAVGMAADMTGHGMSGGKMSGMGAGHMDGMRGEKVGAMMNATGRAFDRMFLTMMIEHHQRAVEMALTEQARGTYPAAVALARSIEKTQTAEITRMKQMLGS
jgi:uncharacterized protein (DUF305 family)